MSTKCFLLALRRFLARRGNCKVIYSDNARTFKAAERELTYFANILKDSEFQSFVADKGIHWKFIVERAPWWGGFYERLVKTIKDPLRKILGRALLTFEELSTILSEVEVIVNHRPLTYVENDPGEPEPLTPAHFLELGYGDSKYPIHFIELIDATTAKESYKKRKTYRTLLLKQLWRRWKEQYLLQENPKSADHHRRTPRERSSGENPPNSLVPVLTKLSIDDPTKWYKFVDRLQRILNSTSNRSTKWSPFELLTGVTMRNKEDLYLRNLLMEEMVEELQEQRNQLRQDAKRNIQKIQAENKRTYDRKRKRAPRYQKGDLVAIQRTQFGSGLKLRPKFLGPYKVIEVKPRDSWGKPSSATDTKLRTTQPTSRISTLTSTDLRRPRERTTHWLLIDAEIGLVLSWLGVQTALLRIKNKI
ncbi:integrase catalytic domain-containing protein [Trichonephila clavipes]|nr:integrase catalytic domain-containing protein [Trichonephila clavipes]